MGISFTELRDALRRIGLRDDDLAKQIFRAVDADGDGALSFTEFSAGLLLAFDDILDDRFHALFTEADGNSDGVLSREEAELFFANARSLMRDAGGSEDMSGLVTDLFGDSQHIRYDELHDWFLPKYCLPATDLAIRDA